MTLLDELIILLGKDRALQFVSRNLGQTFHVPTLANWNGSQLDAGKVLALFRQGRPISVISVELGLARETVIDILEATQTKIVES